MELILNVLWLMLAIPAIWLWRRNATPEKRVRIVGSVSAVILLGCVQMLLFPVVSASDDIHAIRSEAEEPLSTKRIARQSAADRLKSAVPDRSLVFSFVERWSSYRLESVGQVIPLYIAVLRDATIHLRSGRGPPKHSA